MLFTLILAAIGVAVLALILVVLLNMDKISEIFQKLRGKNQQKLTQEDKDLVGFTVANKIDDPDTPVVQGIFNKKTSKIEDGVKIQAQTIGDDVKAKHRDHEVVLYS
jgi:hypothetical protein